MELTFLSTLLKLTLAGSVMVMVTMKIIIMPTAPRSLITIGSL